MLTKEIFSERLKERRKKFGLTQEQLSQILKIKRNTYARYETDAYPPLPILCDICNALGCSADLLLFGVDKNV